MALVSAGSVNHETMVSLAEKHFSGFSQKMNTSQRQKSKFTGSEIHVRDDTMKEVHVAVAVESVGWSHPDFFAFMIIQTIIGNWDRTIGGGKNLSSRLCETVAIRKLAHSLTTFHTSYSDTGLFGSYVVTEPEKLDDLLWEVFNEMVRIGRGATQAEVDRAKTKVKGAILMQLDGTTAVVEDIGRQLLNNGRRISPAELFLRIDAVTVKDIMRVARQYCEDVDPVVAAVGPLELMPDYNQIRGWTYWNRM